MPSGYPNKGERAGVQHSSQTGTRVGLEYDDRLPEWQMQPGESDDSFGAFVVYRELGPRRTLLVAATRYAEADPNYRLLSAVDQSKRQEALRRAFAEWSRKFDWVSRCRAYDAFLDAERVQANLDAMRNQVAESQTMHATLTKSLLRLGAVSIQDILGNTEESRKRISQFSPHEILAVIGKAIILDRLVLGIDSQRDADETQARLSGQVMQRVSPEDLKKLAIAAAIEARANEPDDPVIVPPSKKTDSSIDSNNPEA